MPGGYPVDSTTGITSGTNTNTIAGPHTSSIGNKADPRVDSDLDNSRRVAESGLAGGNHGVGHSEHTSGTGLSSNQAPGYNTGTSSSTTAGPHSSNLENKIDPRVDSDNSRGVGAAANTHGAGYPNTSSSSTAGPHSSSLGNQADPRVDSDLSRSQAIGNHGTTHTGTAPRSFPLGSGTSSSTTAGPHSSNLENKIDPRVDSDRDGSRAVGGQGSSAHPMMDRSYPIQTGYGNSSTNTGSSGHNVGRDAAALGAGGAAGSAIHHHQNQSNVGSNVPSSGTGYDNSATHTGSSGHHLGRDVAALGTAGAAGSAVHHHNQNQSHLGSNTSSTGTGLHGTSGVG